MIGSDMERGDYYPLSRLLDDLKADLSSYARTLSNLERLSFLGGMKIVTTFPTFWLIALHRYRFWVDSQFRIKAIKFFMKFLGLVGRYIFEIITKSFILGTADIGPGLCITGKGGVTLGPNKMGRGCIVGENVTIGRDRFRHIPEFGDFVKIGANSIIFGGVRIGNGVIIKDSTVLTKSVPDDCIVHGNPGRIVKKNSKLST